MRMISVAIDPSLERETPTCQNCGRAKSPVNLCDPESIEDDGQCPGLTIAKLRAELAAQVKQWGIDWSRACADLATAMATTRDAVAEAQKARAELAHRIANSVDLATYELVCDMRIAERAKANEVLSELADARRLGDAERAVIEASVSERKRGSVDSLIEWRGAVDALLRLRKERNG